MTRTKIDPIKAAIIDKALETAAPPSAPQEPTDDDLSIDDLLRRGLKEIYKLMRVISREISTGSPDRNTVMNLRDTMAMLATLKDKEDSLLAEKSTEDLEKLT